MITERELFWLIGILEGEGSFSYTKKTHRVQVQMVDEDVMVRVSAIVTKITGRKHNLIYCGNRDRANVQPSQMLSITGESARAVMCLIVTHMGHRRRIRIWQCLNNYTAKRLKLDIKELVEKAQQKTGTTQINVVPITRRM